MSFMKRLLFALPVVVLGGFLTGYLIFVVGASPEPQTTSDPPPVVVEPKGDLPDAAGMDRLAATDPIAFLENCVRHYDRDVQAYSATLDKQEQIDGILYPPELIEVRFSEHPFGVWLHWLKGQRRAKTALYVAGANNNQIIVVPTGFAGLFGGTMRIAVNSALARASGRYTLDQFGIEKGTLRTLDGWVDARRHSALHVEYLGKKPIPEVGGRLCYCFHRTYEQPAPNGADDLMMYVDAATWLQIGSVIKDRDGKLIGAYYFKDVKLNPTFKPDQFLAASVRS